MKTRLLFAAVAATASLVAACGGEEPTSGSGTPSRESENRKALLDFARCMRENGVDMPDPQFDGGRVTMRTGGPNTDPTKMRAAEKACAKYREAVKPPEMSDEDRAEFKQAALANARCMRENGIKDFPDPTFDENGGAQIRMRGGINPQDPKFQKAMKACEDTMPDRGRTASEEGGE